MCDSSKVDFTGFYKGVGGAWQDAWDVTRGKKPTVNPMKPIPAPRSPTKPAERVYKATRPKRDDEPQLLGTSALRIPLKTIQ